MEIGDLLRHVVDHCKRQLAPGEHLLQHALLGELAHLHGVLDGRPGSLYAWGVPRFP